MRETLHKFYITTGQCICLISWNIGKNSRQCQIWNLIHFFVFSLALSVIPWVNFQFTWQSIVFSIYPCFSLILIAAGTMIKQKRWRKWNKLFGIANKNMKLICHQSIEPDLKMAVFCVLYLFSWFSVGFYLYLIVEIQYNFLNLFLAFGKFYSAYLVIISSNILTGGFTILNESVKFHCRSVEINHTVRKSNVKNIRFYLQLYKNLFEMSNCFNELFGWTIVMIFGELLSSSLIFLNLVIAMYFKGGLSITVILVFCIACSIFLVSRK